MLSEAIGTPMDPEQQLAVDVATSLRDDGRPATLESAIITCRQNLKTFCAERVVLTHLVEPDRPGLQPVRLIVWSAHEFRTAQETFRHFDELIAGHSFLSRRVTKVSRGNGEEEFEFAGGKRLMFRARVRTGGRGLTGDIVVLDEAFALLPAHMGSLLPTLSTRRRAKVIYCSSAGLAGSAILRGVRDRGRAGGAGAPAYIEWCAPGSMAEPGCLLESCQHIPGTPGCSLDREDFWRQANPAIGRRIDIEFVRSERRAMPAAEFARERLGWWDDASYGEKPISEDEWTQTSVPTTRELPVGRRAFVLDVAPGMVAAAIGASIASPVPHGELADALPGTDWVLPRLLQLRQRYPDANLAYDATGAAVALLPKLMAAGLDLEPMSGTDCRAAAAHLQKLSVDQAWTHTEDPILDGAFTVAVKRTVGDGGWDWGRTSSGANIAPLRALTGAMWLAERERESDYDVLQSAY